MSIAKNKDSRCRTKMKNRVQEAFDELVKDEKELMKEFDLLDENDELLEAEKQDEKNVKLFQAQQKILFDEEVVIEGGMYAKNFDEMKRILEETEMTLSGQEADIYDKLLDQMEEQAKSTTKATDK